MSDERQQRGLEIAALARIDRDGEFYLVPSVTSPRPTKYKVRVGENATCNCPDFETRGCKCKHQWAVEYVIKRETTSHADGSTTVTESITVKKTRKTYPQNWPAYNEAQTNEGDQFLRLLGDLCAGIQTPAPSPKGGRPSIPLSDAVFSVVYKIYSTFSGRRFISDLRTAHADGHISRLPAFSSIFTYLENPAMFPILVSLIEQASLPLKSVESKFAVDSTGFAYSRFVRWYDIKYNRFSAEQQWVKAHICTGVQTNVITAVEIHERDAGDIVHLPALVESTAKNFNMKEVSADKGYSGRVPHDAIAAVGATPYIAFKSHTTGAVGGLFQKMFHYFQFQREDFLAHYHQRSNVESSVMMIKNKFGDAVRGKSEVAAKNEVLCKILCHNICCLISAIYELGIDPVFGLKSCTKTQPLVH